MGNDVSRTCVELMHVTICTRSGRSLRRDPSALRFLRSLTPFGECLGLDAMQVISLEGCNPLGDLDRCLILPGHLSSCLSARSAWRAHFRFLAAHHEHSAHILLAEQAQAERVSPQDPLL